MSETGTIGADPPLQEEPRKRRIAVVAIHGVGDHPQFATAREIGDLLSGLEYETRNKDGLLSTPRYAPFTETIKRISVRPVRVKDDARGFNWSDKELHRKTWGPLDAIAKALRKGSQAPHLSEADNAPNSLDHLFMRGQLVKYKGEYPEDTYQCLRLEGKRIAPATAKGEPPVVSPEPDAIGVVGSKLREKGVNLPPPGGRSATGEPSQPVADPAAPGIQEKVVHVYEMYWSDLSQLGNAFTRIFGELYQLLFHLGNVSVNNVLAATIHFHGREKTEKKWRIFSQAQGFVAALLAWPIPILNLYMAALVPVILLLSFMRSRLSAQGEFAALVALAAVLCVAGSGFALSKRRSLPPFLFPVPLALFGVLGIFVGLRTPPWNRDGTEELFALVTLALALGGVWLLVLAYDKRRPGSKTAARWTGLVLIAALVLAFVMGQFRFAMTGDYPAIAICLNIGEIAFGFLAMAWALFYAAYIWAHVAGWLAVKSVRSGSSKRPESSHREQTLEHTKARRVRWTAQLILALSSIIFFSLSLPIWTGVAKVVIEALPGQENVPDPYHCRAQDASCIRANPQPSIRGKIPPSGEPCRGPSCTPITYEPVSASLYRFVWRHGLKRLASGDAGDLEHDALNYFKAPPFVSSWSDQMLLVGGIGFLPLFLAALLLALLITLWAMFPSVWAELRPPDSGPPGESEAERRRAADELARKSISLGVWLDRGFRFMRLAGEALYWAMWLPTLLVLVLNFTLITRIYNNGDLLGKLIAIVGTVVAGAAVGVLGFAGRLKSVAGGFSPVLRVMLDVDNWLREHPRESNPTARICGRYVSLLRYISEWRDSDPAQSPYDAMVIVAHSQGTVITADFLRFLQVEKNLAGSMGKYDPELQLFDDKFPVYFFTMGCPLHQLYGLRFPYLYGWARNEVPDGDRKPRPIPDIGPDDAPRPDRLGVTRWINAYRSGDYVGRSLWRGGVSGYEWNPIETRYDHEWDPPAGKPTNASADREGRRIEFCIGPGAHTHYWDHTAELVAEVLDRLINNA
jgi:hypothetical protein